MVKIYYSFIQKNQKDKFIKHVAKMHGQTAQDDLPSEFYLGDKFYSVSFSGDIIMVGVADKNFAISLEQIKDLDYKSECQNFCTEKEISKISNLAGYYVLLTKKQSMAKYLKEKITNVTFEDYACCRGKKITANSISALFDEYIFSVAGEVTDYEKILIM